MRYTKKPVTAEPIEVEPVVHAHLIVSQDPNEDRLFSAECSSCGQKCWTKGETRNDAIIQFEKVKHCIRCGAKMDEEA